MKKIDLKLRKNVLDLAYQRNLHLLSAVLLIGVGGFAAYLAALILDIDKYEKYTIILVIIFVITLIIYKRIDHKFKLISQQILNLK
jgi:uncharacterized membrane protein